MEGDNIKPYAVFDSIYMLQWCDLYSGNENDPIVDATIYAKDHLAFDSNGNSLPFSLQCSIFAQEIDRDKQLLEDKNKTYRRWEQRIAITVLVFKNVDDWVMYENSGKLWVDNN